MGQIVASMVSCHAPALLLRQPGEDPAQLDATIDGMRRLGQVLDETKPDALIVVGLDHLEASPGLRCTCSWPTCALRVDNHEPRKKRRASFLDR